MRRPRAFAATVVFMALPAWAADAPDRTRLPIPAPQPPTVSELDARDAVAPPRFEVKAPAGAPNVVIVRIDDTNVGGDTALAPGRHTIEYEFIPDDRKPGTGGKSILSVDGKRIAEGHIPKTQPFAFSADEGADVGVDGETNVFSDYAQGANAFTGRIVQVRVEQK